MSLKELHDLMYKNIFLLTLNYPVTIDFNDVFKKDMFMKNNKAAFHHVVYYLLSILDPVKVKQKIKSWPLFEIRQETEFRNEVIAYVNELNKIYEYANLPVIMTSHLISPGGIKFVKFVLKLSTLVLQQHLLREHGGDLCILFKPSKNSEDTSIRVEEMTKKIAEINQDTFRTKQEFFKRIANYKAEAQDIMNKQVEMKIELPKLTSQCKILQEEVDSLLKDSDISLEVLNKRFESLNNKLDYLKEISTLLDEYLSLVKQLQTNKILREDSSENSKGLDVNNLLTRFHTFIKQKKREFLFARADDVNENTEIFTWLRNAFSDIINKHEMVETLLEDINKVLDSKEQNISSFKIPKLKFDDPLDSPLATKLDDSLENKENTLM